MSNPDWREVTRIVKERYYVPSRESATDEEAVRTVVSGRAEFAERTIDTIVEVPETRRCERCGYVLADYHPAETLCGACSLQDELVEEEQAEQKMAREDAGA